MAFTFYEASCVLVGTFNIYIIRPDWLGKIGVLPEETMCKIESRLDQPGFRLSSPKLGSRWTVSPNRLVLETENPQENCGETAARVLEFLPWTPITAVGCNTAYRGTHEEVDHWEEKTAFPPAQVPDGCDLKQRTWYAGIEFGDQRYNLQLSQLEDYVEFRSNVHTDLRNRDVEFAREVAGRFLFFRERANSLFQELFGAEVESAAYQ